MPLPTRIVSTFHQSSSVISSVKCSLSSAGLEHLVVAKLNGLQVFSIRESGLQLECSLEVQGKVRLVRAIPIQDSSRSNIFVLLDHPDPEVLVLKYTESDEPGSGNLSQKYHIQLDERGSRPSEFCTDAIVHSSGAFAVVSCYTGKLKVVMIDESKAVHNLQLSELNLLSFAFLPLIHKDNYALALLNIDYKGNLHLVARTLRISYQSGAELDNEYSYLLPPTSISLNSIPYPDEILPQLISIPSDEDATSIDDDDPFLGGILVVGGSTILLYELASQEKLKGKRKRETSKQADTGKSKKEIKKREAKATLEWPWSQISAWTAIDDMCRKILVGDIFGRLAILSLARIKDHEMILLPLGETSPATSLSYLTHQATFVGSHLGDSQVVRITPAPVSSGDSPTLPIPSSILSVPPTSLDPVDAKGKGLDLGVGKGRIIASKGSFIDVIHTFKNIAPIRDAVLADLDGSGQVHIVTCSGGGNTGSVNVVRIGADFEESASMPGLAGTTDIWPLRSAHSDRLTASAQPPHLRPHTHFITTSLLDTHIFEINGANEVTCVDGTNDFIQNEPTLYIGNMYFPQNDSKSSLVIQVVPSAILLLRFDEVFNKWALIQRVKADSVNTRKKFVVASGNPSGVLVAQTEGWMLSYLVDVDQSGAASLLEQFNCRLNHSTGCDEPLPDWFNTEISAINCPTLHPTKYFSNYVAAGFWHTNQLKIYSFGASQYDFHCQTPPLPSPIRSVHLQFMTKDKYVLKDPESHLCVFVGLVDGTVMTYEMMLDTETGVRELKDINSISLGDMPVSFSTHEADGKRVVIAAGSRAVVFSWQRSHLWSAPVMLKDITAIQSISTTIYAQSLITADGSGLSIGKIKSLDKMHIRSTSLGLDNPRHLVHEATLKVFGVGCVRTEPSRLGENGRITSSFKMLDDATLRVLAQTDLLLDEQIMSLALINVPTNDGMTKPLFCIGTVFLRLDEMEPTSGRILLFEARQATPSLIGLNQVVSHKVSGCVYSVTGVKGMLAAAVNSSVSLYRVAQIQDSDVNTSEYSLEQVAGWNHTYLVNSIASYDDRIVASDQFSSVSLLKVDPSQNLITVARDYSPLWPVAVEAFDTEGIIGADQSLNVFTFSLDNIGNRAILKKDGFFHVGDLVSKLIRGSLFSTEAATVRGFKSTHIFCTLSGQIGIITNITETASTLKAKALAWLETQLGSSKEVDIMALGGISHARHRAPKSSRGRSDADEAAYGFIDGDFLEKLRHHIDTEAPFVENIQDEMNENEFGAGLHVLEGYGWDELRKDLDVLQNLH
ncbi:CPSF A subunit region-domain-containing protein [Rhodocollybia butyracea]|uniref:CPSF A subunit region-domain-containing protein n=1 Tax=Rhodocollybia butyracea TaxID=206335 RepID=A0A9P5PPM3_9AGAR|nr:CPSF A subunit region-domain-containing protein [Rhodocollybia butyracea]